MKRKELSEYLDRLLEAGRFTDYCPNGLQVEGRDEIQTIVTGVTASMSLIEAALEIGADAILVHHGYFWKGEPAVMTGIKKRRIATLLRHDINLYAYHLPLDAHPTLGNNAELGRLLEFRAEGSFGEQGLGVFGVPHQAMRVADLALHIEGRLGRAPLVIGDAERRVSRVGWCTGAAQSYFDAAIAAGVDAFISGEISEPTVHSARESGVAYFSAGHHATERYGIRALGEHLAAQFGLQHHFIDRDNPV